MIYKGEKADDRQERNKKSKENSPRQNSDAGSTKNKPKDDQNSEIGTVKTLSEDDWEFLVYHIKKKRCIPFIGAGACSPPLPLGSQLANDLISELDLTYPLKDKDYLPHVAHYIGIEKNSTKAYLQISKKFESIGLPSFSGNQPHHVLAKLNLPLYLTTNYDDFMAEALKAQDKQPIVEICRWKDTLEPIACNVFNEHLDENYEPSSMKPMVYHLHGHYTELKSMVLTEDDYVDFLIELVKKNLDSFLPDCVFSQLVKHPLLFIGYSLNDWNFRVLYRGLIDSLRVKDKDLLNISVQIANLPKNATEEQKEKAIEYLDKYFKYGDFNVRVYWGSAQNFAADLEKYMEKY